MLTPKRHLAAFVFLIGLFIFWTPATEAAQVVNVKGKRVLILLTPDEVKTVKAGDTFYVEDAGKRLGVVRVVKVQNNRALAGLLKGRAQKGNLLASTSGKGTSKARAASGGDGLIVGALLGYNATSMKIKRPDVSMTLTGSGLAGKLFADFTLVEKLGVRLETGLEQMVAEAGDQKLEINYLTGDIMLRYNVINGRTKFFLASGMGIYYPTSSTRVPEDNPPIKEPPMQTVLLIKGGLMIPLGEKFYAPIQAEYVYFPSSKDVVSSIIGGKIGLGMRW